MGVVAAAAVTGGFTLGSAFVQYYFSEQARKEAKKEARRSEELQIKFAKEETAREQEKFDETMELRKSEFSRTQGLAERGQALNEKSFKFNATQTVIDRLTKMYDRSSVARRQLANSFRNRGRQ